MKKLFFLFLLFFIVSCSKKEPEIFIARVGKTNIPLSEFRDRYEFTPHILQTQNMEQNKRNVFISLTGEKILADEAYHWGLNKNEKFKTYSEQMENVVYHEINSETSSGIANRNRLF